MRPPISIRLDDDVRAELEAQAGARGVGLATLLRDLATRAALQAARERIQLASQKVGERLADDPAGQEFYRDWGAGAHLG